MGDAAPLREQITSDMPQISDWNVEGKLLHDVEDVAALPSGGHYWD